MLSTHHRPGRGRRVARRAAAGALLSLAALPAAASADSLAFIKGGDVWLATTDGSRQLQITTGGGWAEVSQSDTGVIVATKLDDKSLYKLAPDGRPLGTITTILKASWWHGPFDIAVSPDGSKVAYTYFNTAGSTTGGVTYANTEGDPGDYPLHSAWGHPAWFDEEKLLHSEYLGEYGGNPPTIVRGVREPNNQGDPWWGFGAIPEVEDGDIRNGVIAMRGGDGDQYLPLYAYDQPGGDVEYCFHMEQPVGGKYATPQLSPDARRLFWVEGDGIHTSPLPVLKEGACHGRTEGTQDQLLIAGARGVDYGGAEVPARRHDDVPPPQQQPPGPPAQPQPQPQPQPKPPVTGGQGGPAGTDPRGGGTGGGTTLSVAPAKLGAALAKGFTVTVKGADGTAKVTARISAATARKAGLGRKGLVVASGSAKAKGGSAKVTLKFTKAAARKLRKLRSVRLTVQVGGGGSTAVTLRR